MVNADFLRLEVLSNQPVLAREAGLMIERIANAFDQASRSRMIGDADGRLELRKITFGSLYVDLGFLPLAAWAVWDQRDALARFMSFLSDSLNVLRSGRSDQVPPAHRSAFEALAAPVARGHATQVNLFLFGDNERGIEIGPDIADVLMSAVARPRYDGGRGYIREAPAISRAVPRAPLTIGDAISASQVDLPELQARIEPRVRRTTGTMLRVEKQWYVRPETLGGVLVPASGHEQFTLDPDFLYLVEGSLIFDGRRPVGFELGEIMRGLGPSPT